MICTYRGCGSEATVTMIWRGAIAVETCPPCSATILSNQTWLARNCAPARREEVLAGWRAS